MISAKMTKDKCINGDEMTDFYTAGFMKTSVHMNTRVQRTQVAEYTRVQSTQVAEGPVSGNTRYVYRWQTDRQTDSLISLITDRQCKTKAQIRIHG